MRTWQRHFKQGADCRGVRRGWSRAGAGARTESRRDCSGGGAEAGAGGGRGLTHAALAVRRALEAGMAGALEGTDDVDTVAVRTQAVTQGALVHICGGNRWLVRAAGGGGAPGEDGPVPSRLLHWDTCMHGDALTLLHLCPAPPPWV